MNHQPFTIERVYDAPADRVWAAITDQKKMKEWYFDIADFRAEVGFEFSFYGGNEDGSKRYLHLCKVTEVVPGKKLAYSWRYENDPGKSIVIFELFPEGNKTRLKLTHEGVETFSQDNPDLVRKNFEMGWTDIIGNILKQYVEKA